MTLEQLKNKIKIYARKAYKEKVLAPEDPSGFNKISKFPPLKRVLNDLLTDDFSFFIKGVDWVAPKPTTFYIRLKNNMGFFLMHGNRSWVAQVEGKRYYLLNQDEEENCSKAISRLLRYYVDDEEKDTEETSGSEGDFSFDEETSPAESLDVGGDEGATI